MRFSIHNHVYVYLVTQRFSEGNLSQVTFVCALYVCVKFVCLYTTMYIHMCYEHTRTIAYCKGRRDASHGCCAREPPRSCQGTSNGVQLQHQCQEQGEMLHSGYVSTAMCCAIMCSSVLDYMLGRGNNVLFSILKCDV